MNGKSHIENRMGGTMKAAHVFVLFCSLMLPQIARAGAPIVTVLGAGASSCGTWEVDRTSNEFTASHDLSWVLGFVTGIESAKASDLNSGLLVDTDANGIAGWIDNFCKANPTASIYAASAAYTETAHPFDPQ
jgi:hypothetical protein